MSGKVKYSKEQRRKAFEMYWKGRDPESYTRGKYTLEHISSETGVSVAMIHAIARGHR